jgi:hypothetical protein
MQRKRTGDPVRGRLANEAIEYYVDWRHACAVVRHAYEQWSRASADDRALSFGAYRAALDQEESAASLYAAILSGSRWPDANTGGPRRSARPASQSLGDT